MPRMHFNNNCNFSLTYRTEQNRDEPPTNTIVIAIAIANAPEMLGLRIVFCMLKMREQLFCGCILQWNSTYTSAWATQYELVGVPIFHMNENWSVCSKKSKFRKSALRNQNNKFHHVKAILDVEEMMKRMVSFGCVCTVQCTSSIAQYKMWLHMIGPLLWQTKRWLCCISCTMHAARLNCDHFDRLLFYINDQIYFPKWSSAWFSICHQTNSWTPWIA